MTFETVFVALRYLIEILWNTQLPCFDVKEVTSEKIQQRGLLKTCFWKGVNVPCSAIFKTMPTGLVPAYAFFLLPLYDLTLETTQFSSFKCLVKGFFESPRDYPNDLDLLPSTDWKNNAKEINKKVTKLSNFQDPKHSLAAAW